MSEKSEQAAPGSFQALSEAERSELELLRAEKAAREKAVQAAAERAELEALRAELNAPQAAEKNEVLGQQHVAYPETESHAARMMQPDEENLTMAPAQKIILLGGLAIVLIYLISTYLIQR